MPETARNAAPTVGTRVSATAESVAGAGGKDGQMDLPPGFRFHPSDEELIIHYLRRRVKDSSFYAAAIGDVDLNKCEPWDLPRKAKMGEKDWYFFCVRDRKYPTGLRTNRATRAGYWKATGKDKEIFSGRSLVGMKKTLVFYHGRAPRGEKSNWVIHEYRLEGKSAGDDLRGAVQNDWVICRAFHKSSGGKKPLVSGQTEPISGDSKFTSSAAPPLTPSSEPENVPCFPSTSRQSRSDAFVNHPLFQKIQHFPPEQGPPCPAAQWQFSTPLSLADPPYWVPEAKQSLKTERGMIGVPPELNREIFPGMANLGGGREAAGDETAPGGFDFLWS